MPTHSKPSAADLVGSCAPAHTSYHGCSCTRIMLAMYAVLADCAMLLMFTADTETTCGRTLKSRANFSREYQLAQSAAGVHAHSVVRVSTGEEHGSATLQPCLRRRMRLGKLETRHQGSFRTQQQ